VSDSILSQIDQIIEDRLDHWLGKLGELVAIPSISSQNVGIHEAAELVARMLAELDFESHVLPSEANPVVYGIGGSGDRTLLCYNHYDVQPPEPLELWESPPFEATRRGNFVYARGISDDKGQLISRFAAIEAVRLVLNGLPCRIKFVVEGGEETSSPGLAEFVNDNRGLLAADACVWETGGVGYDGEPHTILGLRGILYVELSIETMSRDAHSGSAHLVPNAAWRLVRALASIKDENERVLIPGFYDDAKQPSPDQLDMIASLPDDDQRVKSTYGIKQFVLGRSGRKARQAVFEPTANICGIDSGYQGPGPKTVTPCQARAKMDFRLVPDQDPVDIMNKLRRHLDESGFEDVVIGHLGGEGAGITPASEPFIQMVLDTAIEVYGRRPSVVPLMGGSGPIAPFRDYLQVPVATLGISHPGSLVHAPNENIRVDEFLRGTKHMAHLVLRFASA
jgi:acetylornithine deacetylase/succinyl-diaminopimelate desuccinylase-like protein